MYTCTTIRTVYVVGNSISKTPAKRHTAHFTPESPAANHMPNPSNSESLKLTQLRVQQASWQITACDCDPADNPAPRPLGVSHDQTVRCRRSVSRRRLSAPDRSSGFIVCVLWGMLIRPGSTIPWARRAQCMSGDSSKHMWSGLVADWEPDILSSGLH